MLDAGREYSLQQTLDEHSSSITAVKFAGEGRATEILPVTYHQFLPCSPLPPAPHLHKKGCQSQESVAQQLAGPGLGGKEPWTLEGRQNQVD